MTWRPVEKFLRNWKYKEGESTGGEEVESQSNTPTPPAQWLPAGRCHNCTRVRGLRRAAQPRVPPRGGWGGNSTAGLALRTCGAYIQESRRLRKSEATTQTLPCPQAPLRAGSFQDTWVRPTCSTRESFLGRREALGRPLGTEALAGNISVFPRPGACPGMPQLPPSLRRFCSTRPHTQMRWGPRRPSAPGVLHAATHDGGAALPTSTPRATTKCRTSCQFRPGPNTAYQPVHNSRPATQPTEGSPACAGQGACCWAL